MAARRKESVSASFHFLTRTTNGPGKTPVRIAFSPADFDRMYEFAKAKPKLDLTDPGIADRVRYRIEAPLENLTRIDARTVFGTFRASYSGHAYNNTAKGLIPADSISLRPFHFLLYLGENGHIYIVSQYLGLFGGYGVLQRTICDFLGSPETISSHSFMVGGSAYKNAKAREVRMTFSNKGKTIAKGNAVGNAGAIAFKKQSKDDGFEDEVSEKLIPMMGKPASEIKKAVADFFNESELFEIGDADVEDCAVIARVNGRRKTIHILESGNVATKFPLDVPLDQNGHPRAEATKAAMLEILRNEIISRHART